LLQDACRFLSNIANKKLYARKSALALWLGAKVME